MTIVDMDGRTRARRRWTTPLLVASLAHNLLIIGALIGAMVHFRRAGPFNANGPGANLLGYVTTLPAARREALIAGAGNPQQELRPLRQETRAARAEMAAALAAEPFDRARFGVAQKRLFEAETVMRAAAQRIAGRLSEQLSPEELRAFGVWHAPRRGGGGLGEAGDKERGPKR